MISFAHRAVFVKLPKTAGTSVAAALDCKHVMKPHGNILELRDIVEHARLAAASADLAKLPPIWFDEFYEFGD